MKTNSIPSWSSATNSVTFKRFSELCAVLGHAVAIVCAAGGVYLIVAGPLPSAIYGIALFGVAIALEIIVAAHCEDKTARARQIWHTGIANVRPRKRHRVKGSAFTMR